MLRPRLLVALTAAASLTTAVASCGNGADAPTGAAPSTPTTSASSSQIDAAFVREMSAHHQLAIDMAAVAKHRAKNPTVKRLAVGISTVQKREIAQLAADAERLNVPLDTSMDVQNADAQVLGISMASMGMSMNTASLKTASDFDHEFLSEMIPHHVGAITMARVEVAKGSDTQLKTLAAKIISEQNVEVALMTKLRNQG